MSRSTRRRERLRQAQLLRAKALADCDPCDPLTPMPAGAIPADPENLRHNNTYGLLPRFYVDRVVVCRHCGQEEVWPALRQKWWYEVAKGHIHSKAVLCRQCRQAQGTSSQNADSP